MIRLELWMTENPLDHVLQPKVDVPEHWLDHSPSMCWGGYAGTRGSARAIWAIDWMGESSTSGHRFKLFKDKVKLHIHVPNTMSHLTETTTDHHPTHTPTAHVCCLEPWRATMPALLSQVMNPLCPWKRRVKVARAVLCRTCMLLVGCPVLGP